MISEDYNENYHTGFFRVFRSLLKKGWYKKSDYVHLWIHILSKATHKKIEFFFNGENIKLNPGQFITGRKQLSEETGINESKIERILNFFEKNEHQIEQQKTNRNRLISILNWEQYQNIEQQNEQPVNNKRTTNTYNNKKNNKNNNNNKEYTYPYFETFKDFALENQPNTDIHKLELKFKSWQADNWHDGNGKKIKNWKSKLLNSLQYLQKNQDEKNIENYQRGKDIAGPEFWD